MSRAKLSEHEPARSAEPSRMDLDLSELRDIVARTALGPLASEDHKKLRAAVGTFELLTAEIKAQNASIKRLRGLLFGSTSEKTREVVGEGNKNSALALESQLEAEGAEDKARGELVSQPESKSRPKGHGRNASAALTGAEKVCVPHEALKAGEVCPACGQGKVYPMAEPRTIVRITGMAPLGARVIELERLRCNLCGEIFASREPSGLGPKKYDESVASMVALLKYGAGVPFHRIGKLQEALGIPLPASTQWEKVDEAAGLLLPAYEELLRQAAQGKVLHNDDTTMKILALSGKRRAKAIAAGELDPDERRGIFTTGIVSRGSAKEGSVEIALFFTGSKHAGENLAAVLAKRAAELGKPIHMCDALSHNTAGGVDSTLCHCLAHARRKFVEVAEVFPEQCRHVLEALGEAYATDKRAKAAKLDDDARLKLHRRDSRLHMLRLKRWLRAELRERRTEPNSGLGQAIEYTLKHWRELTLFLREPGAPLDNNICERALKRPILHRKNAYFYKTKNGARVGDLFMSLIYTAELSGISPFDYLNALQVHNESVARSPSHWMPWNYAAAIRQAE